ncbi:glycine-rich domain-containing protein [Crossiella cryophila]|uniref:Uncharacterized protein n=1 Tax=Crossiella cryophila TaxID=43355 RepID=A0A7W7CDY4_9PSEU|nr:hypothetical protein [Crossiella cryophila]MBB4679422.1 hypothetical protein [Crossiella cryophila]
MTAVLNNGVTGASLVSDELFNRLVTRIVTREGLDRPEAEAVMADALAFLKACSVPHGRPLVPSAKVDIGWHTFILDTLEYERFCWNLAGRFLHHVPTDPSEGEDGGEDQAAALARTVAAIHSTGLTLHPELWERCAGDCEAKDCRAKDCSQCHAGCSDRPRHGAA